MKVVSEDRITPFQVLSNTAIQENGEIAEPKIIPKMKTLREMASLTGLSYDYIRKLCLEGRIVHIKTGKKYLVNYDRFIDFLNTGE